MDQEQQIIDRKKALKKERDRRAYVVYRAKQLQKDAEGFRKRHNDGVKKWRLKNLEKERARCRSIAKEKRMLYEARYRAKKEGLPFNIELSDIVIPSHCPVLGIAIIRGEGSPTANSPSLDRITPSLGYVRGNIAVISNRANTLKNNASSDELEMVLGWMRAQRP